MITRDSTQPAVALLGACLAAGALGGWLAARRAPAEPSLADARIWQQVLASRHGVTRGALLIARTHARYLQLYSERPRMTHPALRKHLDAIILPALALYEVLREERGPEEALLDVRAALEAGAMESLQSRAVLALRRVPAAFQVIRMATRIQMHNDYPPEGWVTEWVSDDAEAVSLHIHDCFYLNILTSYGARELTAEFCRIDDVLYAHLPNSIRFERNGTLARGAGACDFTFRTPSIMKNANNKTRPGRLDLAP